MFDIFGIGRFFSTCLGMIAMFMLIIILFAFLGVLYLIEE